MIIPEEILEKVFDTLPEITIAGMRSSMLFQLRNIRRTHLIVKQKRDKARK